MFLTLEDETGVVNVVFWEQVQQRYRAEIKGGNMLLIEGWLPVPDDTRQDNYAVIHLVGQRLACLEWVEIESVRSFH